MNANIVQAASERGRANRSPKQEMSLSITRESVDEKERKGFALAGIDLLGVGQTECLSKTNSPKSL